MHNEDTTLDDPRERHDARIFDVELPKQVYRNISTYLAIRRFSNHDILLSHEEPITRNK